jgi:DNA adenine methylase/adenine-specific DNA-methyltransferase
MQLELPMTLPASIELQQSRPASSVDPKALATALERVASYPRLRYMGSKYRLIPHLAEVFVELGGRTALDAFSGSGVVAYTLKALGFGVTANDFLTFAAEVARATVANQSTTLTEDEIDIITGPPADGRDFIQSTFRGLYFSDEDHAFLDSAWSHIDRLTGFKRSLAISALVLAAARKQPRGVFTVTDLRYDDGRRHLHLPLREHFRETALEYNDTVFPTDARCAVHSMDVFDLNPEGYDLVYLDPPYAPPKDDNCYIKRYHFLEGLSVYWVGQEILHDTKTKKLAKRFTPFSYKRTIVDALERTIDRFGGSDIVLSYSSNAVPDAGTIRSLLANVKSHVEVRSIDHTYSFGTHDRATRRGVSEYLFIGT